MSHKIASGEKESRGKGESRGKKKKLEEGVVMGGIVGGGGTGLLTGMTPVAKRTMMRIMMITMTMMTTTIFTFFHQYDRATF